MKRKKYLAIILIFSLFVLSGWGIHQAKIVTDNGKPLIDLDELLTYEGELRPDENKVEPEPEAEESRDHDVVVVYDKVTMVGKRFAFERDENGSNERLVADIGGVDFDDFLDENNESYKNDSFRIIDEYGEIHTVRYLYERLAELAGEENVILEPDYSR